VFSIISGIKSKNVLEDGINDLENIWRYDWHIDTKYYTADIQLCCRTNSENSLFPIVLPVVQQSWMSAV
jgi:hypothetical protein